MQDMSENERNISCCGATKAIATGGAIGGGFGTAIGMAVAFAVDNALLCMTTGGGVGCTIGLLFAVGFLVHKGYSNNAADIEQSQENAGLLPAQDNVQAPRMYGIFPPSKAADNGAKNSSVQISDQDYMEGPGIFPASNLQLQLSATS